MIGVGDMCLVLGGGGFGCLGCFWRFLAIRFVGNPIYVLY